MEQRTEGDEKRVSKRKKAGEGGTAAKMGRTKGGWEGQMGGVGG